MRNPFVKKWITIKEASQILNVTPQQVHNLIGNNTIKSEIKRHRNKKRIYVDKEDVEDYNEVKEVI